MPLNTGYSSTTGIDINAIAQKKINSQTETKKNQESESNENQFNDKKISETDNQTQKPRDVVSGNNLNSLV